MTAHTTQTHTTEPASTTTRFHRLQKIWTRETSSWITKHIHKATWTIPLISILR